MNAPDEPVFPEYDVVTSEELDASEAAAARAILERHGAPVQGDPLGRFKPIDREWIDNATDEDVIALAEQVKLARLRRCNVCGKATVYVIGVEGGDRFGRCAKHGRKLFRRINPPTMAVPRSR